MNSDVVGKSVSSFEALVAMRESANKGSFVIMDKEVAFYLRVKLEGFTTARVETVEIFLIVDSNDFIVLGRGVGGAENLICHS